VAHRGNNVETNIWELEHIERALPAKRRHNTNDLAASSGTLPYIARREIQTIA